MWSNGIEERGVEGYNSRLAVSRKRLHAAPTKSQGGKGGKATPGPGSRVSKGRATGKTPEGSQWSAGEADWGDERSARRGWEAWVGG